jgi:hypothetical protein
MNLFNIERALKRKLAKGYPKLYWCIDLHDVCIPGRYNKFNSDREFFPGAKEVLSFLSNSPNHCLILWSSSHRESLDEILPWFDSNGIHFSFINENPEIPNSHLCDFTNKFYFDVLLEDKAGFSGETDWLLIKEELVRLKEWVL